MWEPTDATIPHWVRRGAVSGSALNSVFNWAANTWLPVDGTTRQVGYTATSGGQTLTGSFTLELATDSVGSNIVSSRSVSLQAVKETI